MASLSFYGGIGHIGGNKFLLQDGECRLFLDFGLPFAQRKLYYEEYLNPRAGAGLLDPLEMGLLPPLKGIYRPDLEPEGLWERFRSRKDYREIDHIDGVLLSHAHLDHSGYISFLRGDIPIYASALTAFLAKTIQDSGKSDVEHEVCYFTPRQYSPPREGWRLGALEAGDWKRVPAQQRPFRIGDHDPAALGPQAKGFWEDTPDARKLSSIPLAPAQSCPLPLKAFAVDHSIPGATAWAVETSAGWVVYTGDLRFHGKNRQLSQQFVEAAARLHPRALLAEGTYVKGQRRQVAEAEVYENALRAAQRVAGLIIADFAARDVERLLTFLRIARETGRKLVVLTRDAYLLQAVRLLNPEVPEIDADDSLLIYEKAKTNPDRWERGIFSRYHSRLVSASQVHQHQQDYILCFSFFDLNELPSIRPREGSLYIYSSSEAHDEEQEMDLKRLQAWLKHFNLCPFGVPLEETEWRPPPGEEGLHASGHASGEELVQMVRDINPRLFIPVHTEKPQLYRERLAGSGITVHIPAEGEELPL